MSRMTADQDVDIDLRQLAASVWNRRVRVIGVTLLAAGLAFSVAKLSTPQYRSETRILIEPRAPAFANTQQGDSATAPLLDELNIASQVQLLQSADVIRQVIDSQNLASLPEFDEAASRSPLSSLLVALHLRKNPAERPAQERIIDAFTERLQVYQVPGSRVIGISFSSRDPALAAAIPNALAEIYMAAQSGAKMDSNSEATRWLEPEIARLRDRVSAAEQKVAEYRASHGLLTTGNGTFPSQQLNDVSAELTRVRGEKGSAEARAQAVRNALATGQAFDTLPDIMASQSIQRLKTVESSLQSQLSDLETSLLANHPRLRSLRAQLGDIRSQIRLETQNVLTSIENEAKVADLRQKELERQSDRLKETSARAGEDEVGLNALEREAAAERQLLETYLARYREASSRIDRNSSPADARIVSRAVVPADPYFPKTGPIVVVATLAAFIISAVVVMLIELFSGRALRPVTGFSRAEEAALPQPANRPGEAVLLPAAAADLKASAPLGSVEENEFSPAAVAAYLAASRSELVFAVSPTGDEGSAATVSLTRALVGLGRHAVLVDMSATGHAGSLMLRDAAAAGVTDLLAGTVAFGATIHGDDHSPAHVIPKGVADVATALEGVDRLGQLFEALTAAYDTVVVECGAASTESLVALAPRREVEVVLSMPHLDEEIFIEQMTAFERLGYRKVVLMSGEGGQSTHLPQAA